MYHIFRKSIHKLKLWEKVTDRPCLTLFSPSCLLALNSEEAGHRAGRAGINDREVEGRSVYRYGDLDSPTKELGPRENSWTCIDALSRGQDLAVGKCETGILIQSVNKAENSQERPVKTTEILTIGWKG